MGNPGQPWLPGWSPRRASRADHDFEGMNMRQAGGLQRAARSTAARDSTGRRGGPCSIAIVLMLAGALALVGACSASAIVIHIAGGRTVSYTPAPGHAPVVAPAPFDSIFHNLDYNGGPIMGSNTNYTFYWAPAGSPAYPADYRPGLDQFFTDLAHDSGGHENADSVSTQYNDAAGEVASYNSQFAGAIVDTNPYPANGCGYAAICLTDAQIRAELTGYVKAHGLPADLAHEYFVLTPPGVESCLEGSICSAGTSSPAFCAYHGAINLEGGAGSIVYSNDPYVAGGVCDDKNHPNNTTADATISGGLSHEHNESLTDPEPNNAWTDWPGGPSSGYEIGDKCRTFSEASEFGPALGTAPDGAKYNQLINGHEYWYQQEWSNQGRTCLQRFTFKGEAAKAAFTTTAKGELATFDASASTAPGGVAHYEWQLNAAGSGSTPIESASPTLAYEFPTLGSYDVALTVFAADGTSVGTARVVNLAAIAREEEEKKEEEKEGPVPTVAKVAPKKGAVTGGTSVTITGKNLTGATAVHFGAAAAVSYVVNSATTITAVAPASAAGAVDVTVTTAGGTSATSTKDRFKSGPPIITAISPPTGPKAGGTTVTVTGAGFAPGTAGTTFKVGKVTVAASCASITECTLTTPAGKVGAVDVVASVGKLNSAKGAADRFTYQ
jgi:hypothetical protein